MNNGGEKAQGEELAAPPAAAKRTRRNWRALAFLLCCLVGSAAVSFAVFRYIGSSVPRELVGTWQVTDGKLKGATLEFRWYGTGVATQTNADGKKESLESSVRVRGKRIFMTSKNPGTGLEETVIQTILKLADDELVIRDQDEVTYVLIRIRD
jgi:uncharacterized protein (TIGR03066 family)